MAEKVKSIIAEIGIDSSKFTSGANQIQQKTKSIKGDLLGSIKSFAGYTAAITAVGVAIKQVYSAAGEGQEIINAEARLAAFAGGAEEATNVIDAMQESLDGGISRFEAASQASQLFELGLASTTQEAADLSYNIMATGGNINDFSLMIANESKQRLDLYGLSVADVTRRQNELAESNEDLTSQETFAIAVKEQLAAKTKTLETAGYSAVTANDKLEAAVSDMTDSLKVAAAEGFTPVIEKAAEFLQTSNQMQKATKTITDAVKTGDIGYWEAEWKALTLTGEEWIELADDIIKKQQELAKYSGWMEGEKDDWKDREKNTGDYINLLEDVAKAESELTGEMSAELEERQQAITSFNQWRIGEVANWSDIETTYAEDSAEVAEELAEVQEELAEKRSQGYVEWGSTIQGLLAKEEELKDKAQEVEDAHTDATNEIILGYMEQKLAADGLLTDEEVTWLLEKGVEWGVYADNAVAAYQEAQAAADEALTHFKDKTVTLTVQYKTVGASGLGGGGAAGGVNGDATIYEMDADGTNGTQIVPPGYPNDSYTIGLSSGESYRVDTAHNTANGAKETAQAVEFDYEKMGQSVAQAIQQLGVI